MKRAIPIPSLMLTGLLACAPGLSAQTFNLLYDFAGGNDGGSPSGPLAIAGGGTLYGTTSISGAFGWGTVFSLQPPSSPAGEWTNHVLYSFLNSIDGEGPSPLTIGSNANGIVLYGATYFGGTGSAAACQGATCGTVYMLTPPTNPGATWTKTVLHDFMGGSDGAFPSGPLTLTSGPGGVPVLYGTTQFGGSGHGEVCQANGCGTVFSLTGPMTPGGAWTEQVVYTFAANAEGVRPMAGVIAGADGVLYGTTYQAGPGVCGSCGGTVFALYPPASQGGAWIHRTLYTFEGPAGDGVWSEAHLSMGAAGVIFGTTIFGGMAKGCANSCGTVFALTPPASPGGAWKETVLYAFPAQPGVTYNPQISAGPGGVLYGTTQGGGAAGASQCAPFGCGSVFSLTPPTAPGGTWTHRLLHGFAGAPHDGSRPDAGVAISSSGVLYGTTPLGGPGNQGVVFALQP